MASRTFSVLVLMVSLLGFTERPTWTEGMAMNREATMNGSQPFQVHMTVDAIVTNRSSNNRNENASLIANLTADGNRTFVMNWTTPGTVISSSNLAIDGKGNLVSGTKLTMDGNMTSAISWNTKSNGTLVYDSNLTIDGNKTSGANWTIDGNELLIENKPIHRYTVSGTNLTFDGNKIVGASWTIDGNKTYIMKWTIDGNIISGTNLTIDGNKTSSINWTIDRNEIIGENLTTERNETLGGNWTIDGIRTVCQNLSTRNETFGTSQTIYCNTLFCINGTVEQIKNFNGKGTTDDDIIFCRNGIIAGKETLNGGNRTIDEKGIFSRNWTNEEEETFSRNWTIDANRTTKENVTTQALQDGGFSNSIITDTNTSSGNSNSSASKTGSGSNAGPNFGSTNGEKECFEGSCYGNETECIELNLTTKCVRKDNGQCVVTKYSNGTTTWYYTGCDSTCETGMTLDTDLGKKTHLACCTPNLCNTVENQQNALRSSARSLSFFPLYVSISVVTSPILSVLTTNY